MPAATTSLANCYIPIEIGTNTKGTKEQTKKQILDPNRRPSGDGTSYRSSRAIRRLCLDRSVLSSSRGSSLVECGHTKVLCGVQGPRPAASSGLISTSSEFHSGGVLLCEVRFAPAFGTRPESRAAASHGSIDGGVAGMGAGGRGGGAVTPEEIELSARLQDTISASIPLELLRKNVVDVFVMVLQSDGSTFSACVTAASLALADAGVEMYDLVSSCCVAVLPSFNQYVHGNDDENDDENNVDAARKQLSESYHLLADPTEEELLQAEGVVTLAVLPNWKEVTFWDQTGRLPSHIASDALELCRSGCGAMHEFMRQCLVGSARTLGT